MPNKTTKLKLIASGYNTKEEELYTVQGQYYIDQLEADFGKELGADSLDVVELVMAIEDEFELDIEDQAASQIATVQDALDYIEGKWNKN